METSFSASYLCGRSGRFLGQETLDGSFVNLQGRCNLPDRGSGNVHLVSFVPIEDDRFRPKLLPVPFGISNSGTDTLPDHLPLELRERVADVYGGSDTPKSGRRDQGLRRALAERFECAGRAIAHFFGLTLLAVS
jgi:hypothetical protein